MDLNYSSADDAFRAEVRAWLDTNLPADLKARVLNHRRMGKADYVRWHKIMASRGWAAPNWPIEWGGTGWTATQKHIFDDECARAGTPQIMPFGVSMVAPVLMRFGSEGQKRHFLPRILDCTDWWCQGYSEPGSGSDLASLATRAQRHGDHYIVNEVLQHKAVEMFMETEQARSLALLAAVKVDGDDANARARTMHAAKVRVGRAAKFVGQTAIQLHGGMGMTDELPVGHYFKRLTMIEATLGDTDHHLAAFATRADAA